MHDLNTCMIRLILVGQFFYNRQYIKNDFIFWSKVRKNLKNEKMQKINQNFFLQKCFIINYYDNKVKCFIINYYDNKVPTCY